MFKNQTSAPLAVQHGVPQGSVLGPPLFSLYTSPVGDIVISHGLQPALYADDTQLYLAFSFSSSPSVESALSSVQNCISDISNWMVDNKLKLNQEKTELMILTSPRLRSRVPTSEITVGTANISSSPTIRNLGAMFDQAATMEEHVRYICKSCWFYLRSISAIRHMLTREATEKLMHAFISSRLDSCNSLLVNLPAVQIQKLQHVQNAAARIVLRKGKHHSITEILQKLHWLPVKSRVIFKTLCITYKCVYGPAPLYLSELIQPYTPARSLRSNSQQLLCQPSSRTRTYGDRAFAVTAPRLWNELPLNLKTCATYGTFKRELKTHLYHSAFCSI